MPPRRCLAVVKVIGDRGPLSRDELAWLAGALSAIAAECLAGEHAHSRIIQIMEPDATLAPPRNGSRPV